MTAAALYQALPIDLSMALDDFDESKPASSANEYLLRVRQQRQRLPNVRTAIIDASKIKPQTYSVSAILQTHLISNSNTNTNTNTNRNETEAAADEQKNSAAVSTHNNNNNNNNNNNSTFNNNRNRNSMTTTDSIRRGCSSTDSQYFLPTPEWRRLFRKNFASKRKLFAASEFVLNTDWNNMQLHTAQEQQTPNANVYNKNTNANAAHSYNHNHNGNGHGNRNRNRNRNRMTLNDSQYVRYCSSNIQIPFYKNRAQWLYFAMNYHSNRKGSSRNKFHGKQLCHYPIPPLMAIIKQLSAIATEHILQYLMQYVIDTHGKTETAYHRRQRRRQRRRKQRRAMSPHNTINASATNDGTHFVNENENENENENDTNASAHERGHGHKTKKNDSNVNDNGNDHGADSDHSDDDDENENENKSTMHTIFGLNLQSALWMYALFMRLELPLNAEFTSDMRQFARFCMALRMQLDRTRCQSSVLLALLNMFIVLVEDVFRQPIDSPFTSTY